MALISLMTLAACVPAADTADTLGGPGGSGIVTAGPDSDPAASVDADTACELVDASATLTGMTVTGAPADTQLVSALSYCELELHVPSGVFVGANVEIVPASNLEQTVGLDPTTFGGTIVPLPELGEHGYFLALTPGVDPATDPDTGAISAARGDLGITLAWASRDSGIPFGDLEQAVREMLDALP